MVLGVLTQPRSRKEFASRRKRSLEKEGRQLFVYTSILGVGIDMLFYLRYFCFTLDFLSYCFITAFCSFFYIKNLWIKVLLLKEPITFSSFQRKSKISPDLLQVISEFVHHFLLKRKSKGLFSESIQILFKIRWLKQYIFLIYGSLISALRFKDNVNLQ